MNCLQQIDLSQKVLQAIVFKKRRPLVVIWNLTYKCNLECTYCGFWERKTEELDTKGLFHMADELEENGTKFVSFTGGEPFLRKDLKDIIDYCKNKGMNVVINTNGLLLKKQIEKIKNVDEVQLSLDGPKEINDAVRGKGDHDKVIEAIEACKQQGLNVGISCVISKHNCAHISYMLDFGKKYNVGVYFHPADQNHSGDSNKKITDMCVVDDFKKAISTIIDEKSKGHKHINNTLAGLKHLSHWPESTKIFCFLKLIGCFIEPDGSIFICDNFANYEKYIVPVKSTFKESFDQLELPHPCEQCWCGPIVDFNLMGSFNPESLMKIWKRYS